MPVVNNATPTTYHPTEKRKVLATADVRLQQVQVVDKKGQVRSVILWRCGTDVMYANTMDGLFDSAQRRQAPDWLITALKELPLSQQFNSDGSPKTTNVSKEHIPSSSDDTLPNFVQG